MKQCAVLFIDADGREVTHRQGLETAGFDVTATQAWPDDGLIRIVEAVVVVLKRLPGAAMLAARMRAKPHFGRRVLIGMVPDDAPMDERRAAAAGGFDDILALSSDPRQVCARILRRLRKRREFPCSRV